MTRWATFDCYGTLIDWNAGIRAELARVFDLQLEPDPAPEPEDAAADEAVGVAEDGDGDEDGDGGEDAEEGEGAEEAPAESPDAAELDALLDRYHALERDAQRDGSRSYREVMTEVMRRLGAPEEETGGLADSLPSWRPFPEVPAALADIKERGWKIGILSNSDPDLIAASVAQLGVEADEIIVAADVRGFKPSLRFWTEFYARTLADKRRHVHVGASLYHDIAPAVRLRLPNVWINRLDEHPGPSPTVELPDLEELPDALDGLIPPG